MPVHDAYSAFKAIHFPEHLAALKARRWFAPPHVQVIVSDLCNEDCNFCAYRMTGYMTNELFGKPDERGRVNPNRMIPFEKVIEILDDCAEMGVKAIQFTGGGEPTVHPKFTEIMAYARKVGLKFSVTTNGYRWPDDMREEMKFAEWVRMSMDAGSRETYASIRRVPEAAFGKALGNLRWLSENRGKQLVLGVGFVVTADNWTEVIDGARIAKNNGADYIRFSAAFSQHNDVPYRPFYEQARLLLAEARKLESKSFRVYDRFGERVEDLRQQAPDYDMCGYQFFTTYIGGDMNVYRCCNTSYNNQGLIGSIKDVRFKDLWMSDLRASGFYSFDPKTCERCQFNGINRFLNYAAEKDPTHVEFV